MKKLYSFLILVFISFYTNAQIVNIPDANFKTRLLAADTSNEIAKDLSGNYVRIDVNYNHEIEESEAIQIRFLYLMGANISNLSGIEHFTNLKELNCEYNHITNLGTISTLTQIETLYCNDNQLTSLNVSPFVNLKKLNCSFNQIQTLDFNGLNTLEEINISGNLFTSIAVNTLTHLTRLECYNNQINALNVSNLTLLEYLNLQGNQVTTLDVSTLLLLKHLDFGDNHIASIDLSGLTQLNYLGAQFNLLTTLNVSGLVNLTALFCNSNQLTSLDLTGLNLIDSLAIESNQIPTIDISGLTLLQSLYAANNLLTNIDVSTTSHLDYIDCQNNLLTSINVKNGHAEETFLFAGNNNLKYICADDSQSTDIQNSITENALTNCQVNTYCSFSPGGTFYTISGTSHIDYNNNGCDSNDLNYQHLNLAVTNGSTSGNVISDNSGHYTLDLIPGNYTITPIIENPSYFNISPTSLQVTYPGGVSPLLQDFCITPNGTHNDLEIILIPLTPARPGFDSFYKLIYKNKGNFPQSGNITFAFDDNKTDFISSVPIPFNQNTGLLSWDYSNLMPFESREIKVVLNINSPMDIPAVNGGDLLNVKAVINPIAGDEMAIDNIGSLKQLVVNSLDPNDKTCLEGTTVSESMVGEYIHYLIRFENTGTANAENIVVKDIIDTTKYDISSLVPMNGSASFVTRISNTNQVEFIFENINLPFDDTNNDGYVTFKIKTKPTLVEGDTFSNTASIYFDYNFPVVTEPAITTIQTLATQDFDFENVFSLYPVPAKDVLTISTKQTIVISSVSIYNTLGQLIQLNTNPTQNIDVSGLKTGTYFITVKSDKGLSNSKFIKN